MFIIVKETVRISTVSQLNLVLLYNTNFNLILISENGGYKCESSTTERSRLFNRIQIDSQNLIDYKMVI